MKTPVQALIVVVVPDVPTCSRRALLPYFPSAGWTYPETLRGPSDPSVGAAGAFLYQVEVSYFL